MKNSTSFGNACRIFNSKRQARDVNVPTTLKRARQIFIFVFVVQLKIWMSLISLSWLKRNSMLVPSKTAMRY